jgi:hypothetical protein
MWPGRLYANGQTSFEKPGGQVFILHTREQSVKNEDLTPMFLQHVRAQ